MRPLVLILSLPLFPVPEISAQTPFLPLDTNFITTTVIVPPSPFKYDLLFSGNTDYVFIEHGTDSALAKQNMDYIGVLPGHNKDENYLIVDHEITNLKNDKLGDGGGMTMFKIQKDVAGSWQVVPSRWGKKFINVDFSNIGGTNHNCSGAITPFGTVLSAEEFPLQSNAALFADSTGFTDTSDYIIPPGNGIYSGRILKHWQQIGWMAEVDPDLFSAVRKYYSMGYFSHEDAVCMSDGKTVYLTDDNTPSVLFKFVADEINNYVSGQLYAYSQHESGTGGSWLPLPMQMDSLLDIRRIALTKGATIFTRLEGICANTAETKLYFTETGSDYANQHEGIYYGGKPVLQTQRLDTLFGSVKDSIYNDYYGRVWEMDLADNTCFPLIEGGNGSDGKTNFSNPDNVSVFRYGPEREFLFVQEDLNGVSYNRQPPYIISGAAVVPEIYCLDLKTENPTVDSLQRFIIGPKGCETSGGSFSADGNTFFMNVLHPSLANPYPFNNSCTIAVSGLKQFLMDEITTDITDKPQNSFYVFPNPAGRELLFNKKADIYFFDDTGNILFSRQNTNILDISSLNSGVYFIRTAEGEVQKVVIQ